MNIIKSSRNRTLAPMLLLTYCLLTMLTTSQINNQNHQFKSLKKSFTNTDFDLFDDLEDFFNTPIRKLNVHRQEDNTSNDDDKLSPTTSVENDSTNDSNNSTETSSFINFDEILPNNLFTTPDLVLNETHPQEESEAYLQILQSMKGINVSNQQKNDNGNAPLEAGLNQKIIQTKPGLNLALLKVLSLSNQLSSDAKSSLTSDSMTINKLVQNYAAMAFGSAYVPVAAAPVQNQGAENVQQSTSVVADDGVNNASQEQTANSEEVNESNSEPEQPENSEALKEEVSSEVQEVPAASSPAEEETKSESENEQAAPPAEQFEVNNTSEDTQVARRLLTLMRMYAEHVENKNKDIIINDGHYGYLKSFSHHLGCITDKSCDFSRHLSAAPSPPPTAASPRHLLEKYVSENRHFEAEQNDQLQTSTLDLLKALPQMVSNDQIKTATSDWIAKNHDKLNSFLSEWPTHNQNIQDGLSNIKEQLPMWENLTPEQLLGILDQMSVTYKKKIDQEFTASGLSKETKCLINLRNGFDQLHSSLKNVIPVGGVLDNDFKNLEKRLQNHIDIFKKAQNASPEQLANARIYLKNNLQMNINGVDPVKNSQLIQSLAQNIDDILNSDFGHSLNSDNLNFIVQKAINSFHLDLDQMKDSTKASGFMMDQNDLQKLTDNVVDNLKQSRENNQKVVLNFVDLQKLVQVANKQYNATPNNNDDAMNAADLLISYENGYYEALASDEFYDSLKMYISKYYDIYLAHVKPLDPFFQYSSAYQTLTAGLDNPNALGNVNPQASRLLMRSIKDQMKNLRYLTTDDKKFFKFMNHLAFEWAHSTDIPAFVRKLDSIIQAVQGLKPLAGSIHLMEINQAHLEFAMFQQLKDSVMGVINNIGNGVQGATGLGQTLGNTQGLVQKAADEYHVSDLLTSDASSTAPPTTFWGKLVAKIKGWFSPRKLEVHYGLMDSIESVKNLYKSITDAKATADNLKTNFEAAKGMADNVQNGVNSLSSVFGGKL